MERKVPEWLDNAFLASALQGGEDEDKEPTSRARVAVKHFSAKLAVPPGNNYTSYVFRVRVEYKIGSEDRSTSLIIKAPIANIMPSLGGIFEKEPKMYRDFFPTIQKLTGFSFAPNLYYSSLPNAMVMDDLKEEGFSLSDRYKQLNFSHCDLVLKTFVQNELPRNNRAGWTGHCNRDGGEPGIGEGCRRAVQYETRHCSDTALSTRLLVMDLITFIWTSANEDVRETRLPGLIENYRLTLNATLERLGCEERLTEAQLRGDFKDAIDCVLLTVCTLPPVQMSEPTDIIVSEEINLEDMQASAAMFEQLFSGKYYQALLPKVVKHILEWVAHYE